MSLELRSVQYFPKGKIAYCLFFDSATKTHYTVPLRDINKPPTQAMIDEAVKASQILPK